MADLETYQRAYHRAIIAGDEGTANEARRFILRELKKQGATYEAALNYVSRVADAASQAKNTGVIGNFVRGMGAGAVGLGESAALGLATVLEEDEEVAAREKIKQAAQSFMPEGGNQEALSYKIGSGIGSILGLAPTALIAATPLGQAGALATAGAISMAAGAGEASERAREEGATERQRGNSAVLGALVGSVDVLPLGRMFKAFEIEGLNKILSVADPKAVQSALDRVANAGKTGTVEGLQEFGSAVAQNAIERGYNPEQLLVDAQAIEEGGIGAAAGAILQGVIDTVVPGRRAMPGTPDIEPAKPAAQPTVAGAGEPTPTVAGTPTQTEPEIAQSDTLPEDIERIIDGWEEQTGPSVEGRAARPVDIEERKRAGDIDEPTLQRQLGLSRQQAEELVIEGRVKAATQRERIPEGDTDVPALARKIGLTDQQGQRDISDMVAHLDEERRLLRETDATPIEGELLQDKPTELATTEATVQDIPDVESEVVGRQKLPDKRGVIERPDLTYELEAQDQARRMANELSRTPRIAQKDVIFAQDRRQMDEQLPLPIERPLSVGSARFIPTPDGDVARVKADGTPYKTEAAVRSSPAYRSAQRVGPTEVVTLGNGYGWRYTRKPAPQVETATSSNVQQPTRQERVAKAKQRLQELAAARKSGQPLPQKGAPVPPTTTMEGQNAKAKPAPTAVSKAPQSTAIQKKDAANGRDMGRPTGKSVDKPAPVSKRQAEVEAATVETKPEEQAPELRRATRNVNSPRKGKKNVPVAAESDLKPSTEPAKRKRKSADPVIAEADATTAVTKEIEAKLEKAKAKAPTGKKEKAEHDTKVRALEESKKALRTRTAAVKSGSKNLPVEALLETAEDVPLLVRSALVGSRLKDALTRIREGTNDQRLRNILKMLADNAGNTQVMVLRNLTSPDGTDVAGYFDPKTNTIYLDAADGMNVHTIMHETLHAVTSATLAKKANTTTKQLQALFEAVKDKLGTAYGAKDLDEFVAEAYSNPEFQRELARIRPDGSPIPAWKQFVNTVINMTRYLLGLDTKPIGSALSEMDALIVSAIHPAPSSRMAGELLMESTPDYVGSKLGEVMDRVNQRAATEAERKKWLNGVVDFIGNASDTAKAVFNRMLQMQGLADVAEYYGLGTIGHRMLKVFNEQHGAQQIMDQKVQDVMARVGGGYNRLSDKQRTLVNAFIYDEVYGATISQVDVDRKTLADYSDPDQREAYKVLKEIWDSPDFGPEAKRVYREARKFFEDMRYELEQTLRKRIEEVTEKTDASQRAGLRDKLIKKLIEGSRLDVYFPLMREGDYVVVFEVRDDNGFPTTAVRQFESQSEAKLFIKTLEGDKDYVKGSAKTRRRSNQAPSIKDVPPTSFMYDILKELEINGAPKEAISDIVDVYINTLPEASILKGFKRRQNTAGYLKDMNYALNRKGYQMGAQIVRLQTARDLGKLVTELRNTVSDEAMPEKTKYQVLLAEELERRADFVFNGAKSKGIERVVKNANQFAFLYTIGFNTASALVNLSQVPMVAFPMLGGKYGWGQANKALLEAASIVFGARNVGLGKNALDKAMTKASIAHGVDKYFTITRDANGEVTAKLRTDLDLPEERIKQLRRLEDLVLEAKKQGQLTTSFLAEALGLAEGGKQTKHGFFNKFVALSAGMFSQAERFNRQVTLLAAYNLEFDRLYAKYKEEHGHAKATGMAKSEATQYAIEYTQRINGGSTLETASGLSQEGLGRIALMYKNYGIQMYTMMFQTAKQAANELFKGSPEQRKTALRQLFGLYGSALFFSGVYGMPLYGAFAAVYNAFADDDEDDFDTVVQSFMGQGMFRGGLNAMLEAAGLDIDAGIRMRMTDLLFQENRFTPNPSVEEQLGSVVGGVVLSIGKRAVRGWNDIMEGNYQRGIEQLVPAAITNVMKSFRYAEEGGIRTRRYDLVHGDLSSGELAAQLIGFAPEPYLRQQEENRRLKNVSESINRTATKLTKRYYLALRTGDFETLGETLQDIMEFNRRNPRFAIDPKRIQRSLKGHIRTSENMYHGVSLDRRTLEYVKQFMGDVQSTVIFPDR